MAESALAEKKVSALSGLSGIADKAQAKVEETEEAIRSSELLKTFKECKKMLSSQSKDVRLKGLLKLENHEQSKEVVDLLKKHLLTSEGDEKGLTLSMLLKQKVKGLGEQMAALKTKVSDETRMRLAYNSRYVDDPGLASELMNWFKSDKDELVKEYALLGMQAQSQNVDLAALKAAKDKGGYAPYLMRVLEETISKVEEKTRPAEKPAAAGLDTTLDKKAAGSP